MVGEINANHGKKCKSVSVQIMKSELGKKGNKWKSKLRNYLM